MMLLETNSINNGNKCICIVRNKKAADDEGTCNVIKCNHWHHVWNVELYSLNVVVSGSYYEKSGQYGTGERRDTQLRYRYVEQAFSNCGVLKAENF